MSRANLGWRLIEVSSECQTVYDYVYVAWYDDVYDRYQSAGEHSNHSAGIVYTLTRLH